MSLAVVFLKIVSINATSIYQCRDFSKIVGVN
jgi:hypothetical protein